MLGGAYYRREFCALKWVWLHNKKTASNLKTLTLKVHGVTFGRPSYNIGRIFASEVFFFLGGGEGGGLLLGGLVFEEGVGLIIFYGILL